MDIENEYKEENIEEMDIEDCEESYSLKRIKNKNQRISNTIDEKLKNLNEYDKIKNQREIARKYDIPIGTVAGWIKIEKIEIR